MTQSYSSFSSCKINHPAEDVFVHKNGTFYPSRVLTFNNVNDFKRCDPIDYCTTLKEFFEDGFILTAGDIILTPLGEVVKVTMQTQIPAYVSTLAKTFVIYSVHKKRNSQTNKPQPPERPSGIRLVKDGLDKETPFKETKTDTKPEVNEKLSEKTNEELFEKVEDDFFNLSELYKKGILYYKDDNKNMKKIVGLGVLGAAFETKNVYKLIDDPKRDEFLEYYHNTYFNLYGYEADMSIAEKIYADGWIR